MVSERSLIESRIKEEKEKKDYERFMRLMYEPLINLSDEDLQWAYKQDKFNSYTSKQIFYSEMLRRKIHN